MTRPDRLMLFAAGKGTRMAPLTDTIPKPLIKVAGRNLLDRALDMAREAGVGRIVVNTHYLGEQIISHLAGKGDVVISDESDLLRETGGGLKHALPLLAAESVLTLNPDCVWTGPNPLAALSKAWNPQKMDALLMLVPLSRAGARLGGGDFGLDAQGRLRAGGDFVYGGASVINAAQVGQMPEEVFSLTEAWREMIAQGRAYGLVHDGYWCDVGRPDAIPVAEKLLAEH